MAALIASPALAALALAGLAVGAAAAQTRIVCSGKSGDLSAGPVMIQLDSSAKTVQVLSSADMVLSPGPWTRIVEPLRVTRFDDSEIEFQTAHSDSILTRSDYVKIDRMTGRFDVLEKRSDGVSRDFSGMCYLARAAF